MTEKTILILADGMRRDAPDACGSVFAKKFNEISVYRREISIIDRAPTIAKVYGIKAPHEWDGESLI